jgi:hypothetical protein
LEECNQKCDLSPDIKIPPTLESASKRVKGTIESGKGATNKTAKGKRSVALGNFGFEPQALKGRHIATGMASFQIVSEMLKATKLPIDIR